MVMDAARHFHKIFPNKEKYMLARYHRMRAHASAHLRGSGAIVEFWSSVAESEEFSQSGYFYFFLDAVCSYWIL